jgi:hypothetical protein
MGGMLRVHWLDFLGSYGKSAAVDPPYRTSRATL